MSADDAAAEVSDGLEPTLPEDAAESKLTLLPRDSGTESIVVNRVGAAPPKRCRKDDASCVWRFDGWIIRAPFTVSVDPVIYRCTVHAISGAAACGQRHSFDEPAPGEFDRDAAAKALAAADASLCGENMLARVYFAPAGKIARIEVVGAGASAACIRAKLSIARVAPFTVPNVPEIGIAFIAH